MRSVTLTWLAVARSLASSNGPPSTACSSITPDPSHHGASPQTGASPYKVEVSATSVTAGGVIDVTISGDDFKGFLLQARNPQDNPVGSFELVAGSKFLGCSGLPSATVTHDSSSIKKTKTFRWTAPSEASTVKVVATVVKTRTEFWVKLESPSIEVTASNGNGNDDGSDEGGSIEPSSSTSVSMTSFLWIASIIVLSIL